MTRLRPARAADAAACGAILRGWIEETPWMPDIHPPESAAPFVAKKIAAGALTVAEEAGDVVGFLALEEKWVTALYIAGRARRRGVGTALLRHAISARPARLALWTFAANAPARAFYAREGFVEVEETEGLENEVGLPAIRLLRRRRWRLF